MEHAKQEAIFGGGCFWCLEALFEDVRGVESVQSGYAGGSLNAPSYEQVSSGTTGHAEVVRIVFDPKQVSYADLVRLFFHAHDPTTMNRQGNDEGTQYRSIILFVGEEQKATALQVIKEITEKQLWPRPLVTQVEPLQHFWPAEAYHNDYFRLHPEQGYCRVIIAPKVAKFRREHRDMLKSMH